MCFCQLNSPKGICTKKARIVLNFCTFQKFAPNAMLRTSSSSDGSGSKKAWGPTFGEGPKTKQAWSLRFGREGLEILSFFDCQGSELNIQLRPQARACSEPDL